MGALRGPFSLALQERRIRYVMLSRLGENCGELWGSLRASLVR
jgi:hypothetical protein